MLLSRASGGLFSDIISFPENFLVRPAASCLAGIMHMRSRDEPRSKISPSSLCVYIRTYIYKNTYPLHLGPRKKIGRSNFSDLALVCTSSSQVLYIKAIRERSSEHVRVFCNPTLFIFLVEPSVKISKLTRAYWFQEKTVLCHNGSHRKAHLRRIL